MSPTIVLTLAIGSLIPIVNGLITKYTAREARVYLQIILNAVNGFLVELLHAATTSADFNFTQAIYGWIASLVVALAVEAKIYAPLGISEKVKLIGRKSDDASVPAATGTGGSGF